MFTCKKQRVKRKKQKDGKNVELGVKLEQEVDILRRTTTALSSTPKVQFHSTIGALSEFHTGDSWELYEARLGQYIIANNIPEEKKVATLITLVGAEAYKILNYLCDPVAPEQKTFDELCAILKKQFSPKVAVYKERLEFYSLSQGENETVNQWYARIKSKAVKCKFGEFLDQVLKNKFVSGLRPGPILDRVYEEDHK